MVKVALVLPGKDIGYAVCEPITLGYIASYLETHGIDVAIVDELAGQDVKKELEGYNPDFVGISITTPTAHDGYRIADLCRKMGFKTVIGGVHATVLPHEALEHSDMVVVGEGEEAMLKIAQGKIEPRGIIPGTCIQDIDEIPMPARHLMQMDFYLRGRDRFPDSYYSYVPPNTKVATFLSGRGCVHKCIFCHNSWRKIPYRFHSAERVVNEMEHLIKTYGVGSLFSIEDNFFTNKSRLKKICQLMKKRKIKIIWAGNARVDNIDLETLKMVREVGCVQITFGFESGSQRILDILEKGTSVEQNKNAIELCRKVGIRPQGTFIVGSPTETIEEIRMTQKFIIDNNLEKDAGICVATPFPGTKLWEKCKEQGRIPKKVNWDKLVLDHAEIACTMDKKRVQGLFEETAELVASTIPMSFDTFFTRFRADPIGLSKSALKNPKKIIRMANRLIKHRK